MKTYTDLEQSKKLAEFLSIVYIIGVALGVVIGLTCGYLIGKN